MVRLILIAGALIASATCVARPMIIHEAQVIDAPAGYYYFGLKVAIDGDWAIIAAATASPTPANPRQTHDALLYHRVNGVWTLDRTLIRRVSTEYGQYVGFCVGSDEQWRCRNRRQPHAHVQAHQQHLERNHPSVHRAAGYPDLSGTARLMWDGNALLAADNPLQFVAEQRPWGALISRLNTMAAGPRSSAFQAATRVATSTPCTGTSRATPSWRARIPTIYEVVPDQLHIFRRSGNHVDADVGHRRWRCAGAPCVATRSSSRAGGPLGTLVYRNDDSQTVIDNHPRRERLNADRLQLVRLHPHERRVRAGNDDCTARTLRADTSMWRCSCRAGHYALARRVRRSMAGA